MELLSQGFSGVYPCETVQYVSTESYPFPWKMTSFFRAFPRSVLGKAAPLEPLKLNWDDYDLIFLGGQVWFLSPSLPLHSFLNSHPNLSGKFVVPVITCRNLWYSATRILREKLLELGAKIPGQITLCEISPIWASFVTTPRWMLTGRKAPFAFFPAAGIREQDFAGLPEVGRNLAESWVKSKGQGLETSGLKSNLDRPALEMMDRIGRRVFEPWAKFILWLAPNPGVFQDFLLILFRINLILLILSVAPITRMKEAFSGNTTEMTK